MNTINVSVRKRLSIRRTLCVAVTMVITGCATQSAKLPEPGKHRLNDGKFRRIACVGDSITYGTNLGRPDLESFPAVLGQLLGENCQVRNFGQPGATIQSYDPLLWDEVLNWSPDIVIIKIGTNDSRETFPDGRNAYIERYEQRIAELRALPSNPEIYLCIPIWTRNQIFDRVITGQVAPAIRRVAAETKCGLIDLHRPFYRDTDFFAFDDYHPTAAAQRRIAEVIYSCINQDPSASVPTSSAVGRFFQSIK